MKNKYLRIIAIFFLLATVNELIRPWVHIDRNTSAKRPAGYYIIGYKPGLISSSEIDMMFGREGFVVDYDVQYDYLRLNLQRASILALFLAVLLYSGPRNMIFRLLAIVPSIIFLYSLYLLLSLAIRA